MAPRYLATLFLGLAIAACARTPDDQAIRGAIAETAAAIEARRGSDVLDIVSADFIGNDGIDRDGLRDLLRARLLAANAVGVHVGSVDVDVRGDRAIARFDAVITDTSGRWIPDRMETLHFETGWRREGRDWHCYNANWSSDAR